MSISENKSKAIIASFVLVFAGALAVYYNFSSKPDANKPETTEEYEQQKQPRDAEAPVYERN